MKKGFFTCARRKISSIRQFRDACPSPNVNAWRVDVHGTIYLVTPAHVAVFIQNSKWKRSHFIDDYANLDWKIPISYVNQPSPKTDISWAKMPGARGVSLEIDSKLIEKPTKATVMFRQPYDAEGKWVGPWSQMGMTEAVLYKSPSDSLVEGTSDAGLLESIDTGFRGMSGAMAFSEEGKCIGMFVKKGELIKVKSPEEDEAESSSQPMKPMPISAKPSWFEAFLFPTLLKGIDARFDHLEQIVLTKSDMKEMSVVFDIRRGVFLPGSTILSIEDMPAAHVNDIVGLKAPKIRRF